MKPREGRVALVAGATRGAGRGIAPMLGEADATVYCTSFARAFGGPYRVADEDAYTSWRDGPMEIASPDWPLD